MRGDRPGKFVTELDWNLLRTFVVIVEEGSITAAANRLMRSQPTVSLALQRLEAKLDTQLIDRVGGAFRLTAAGRSLYRECADIYGNIARLNEVTDEASREITGNIHIALASHVVTPLLDETLSSFFAQYPKVTCKISIDTSAGIARNVADKSVSFGICLVKKKLHNLEYDVIYREFFGYFCGPGHPLFGKKGLRMRDLHDYPMVSFDTDDIADVLRPVALLRRQHQLEPSIVGRSSHLEEVKRMIACGLGIGPLPVHVVERDVRDGLLWRLPPYDKPPAIDIYLVSNPGKRFNRAEIGFIASLKDGIAKTPLAERTYRAENQK